MKKIKQLLSFACLAMIYFSVSAYSTKSGGDSFEVWWNGKRVLQEYVYVAKGIQTLHFNPASPQDRIDVYYSHCGQPGKNRFITIRDDAGQTLKTWKFSDGAGKNSPMSFQLKDLLLLKKTAASELTLLYSSQQLPAGRVLAVVYTNPNAVAAK